MKIEEGKRYVTRGGWITPPLQAKGNKPYPFGVCGYSWSKAGESIIDRRSESDLVSEYVEPTPAEPSRLEIAARVLAAMSTPCLEADGYSGCIEEEIAVREALERADALIAAERETRE